MKIKEAIKYGFKEWKRLFYFWWLLIPILGWLAFMGYIYKLIDSVLKGKKVPPKFGGFWDNLEVGFYFFLLMMVIGIITNVIYGILMYFSAIIGLIFMIYVVLISPMLYNRYVKLKSFKQGLNFVEATKLVFNNFGEYVKMYLRLLVVILFYLVCSIPIITLIVTFPAMCYAQYALFAEFYRRFA